MALGCSGLVEVISRDDLFVFISKKSYNFDIIIQKKARIFSKSKKYRFPANYFSCPTLRSFIKVVGNDMRENGEYAIFGERNRFCFSK